MSQVKVIINPDDVAPEGKIWRCGACGKTAQHRYGDYEGFKASFGWDESCMLNAVLVDQNKSVILKP